MSILMFLKRIPMVLYCKLHNRELQESFAPIYPQRTQGEFNTMILNGLIKKHEEMNSSLQDKNIWESHMQWLYNSCFFREQNRYYLKAKKTYEDYLKRIKEVK